MRWRLMLLATAVVLGATAPALPSVAAQPRPNVVGQQAIQTPPDNGTDATALPNGVATGNRVASRGDDLPALGNEAESKMDQGFLDGVLGLLRRPLTIVCICLVLCGGLAFLGIVQVHQLKRRFDHPEPAEVIFQQLTDAKAQAQAANTLVQALAERVASLERKLAERSWGELAPRTIRPSSDRREAPVSPAGLSEPATRAERPTAPQPRPAALSVQGADALESYRREVESASGDPRGFVERYHPTPLALTPDGMLSEAVTGEPYLWALGQISGSAQFLIVPSAYALETWGKLNKSGGRTAQSKFGPVFDLAYNPNGDFSLAHPAVGEAVEGSGTIRLVSPGQIVGVIA